jgi:hypothetical protein
MTAQLKFGVLALLEAKAGKGQVADELLAAEPDIRLVDVIAAK